MRFLRPRTIGAAITRSLSVKMADLPSISVRKYIRRGNGPEEEPTSTLVLTSAAKQYVDVRVLKPTSRGHPMTSLNWAFAGHSTSTSAEYNKAGELIKPAHTAWAHWIDSDTQDEVNDEGDMYLQSDGTVLEKGVNEDGSTYEELWEELEPKRTGEDQKRVSYVLRAENSKIKARGLCIRIGDWVQGTLRVGDDFTVVRWLWFEAEAEWKEMVKIGNGTIPCSSLFHGFDTEGKPAMDVGSLVTGEDQMTWTCIEAFLW